MSSVPDLTEQWFLSNIVFVFDEDDRRVQRRIYANKDFLSVASPVMRALFGTEHFRERGACEIPLPGKKFEDVLKLMSVIHAPFQVPITDQNVYEILPLAHEYQMDQIVKICESHMAKNPCVRNLFLAEKYELKELMLQFTNLEAPDYMCTTGSENIQYLLNMKPETIVKVYHQKLKCIANAVKRGKFPVTIYGNMSRTCLSPGSSLHRLGENKACEHCKRVVVTVVTSLLNKDEEQGQPSVEMINRFTSKEQENIWNVE